MDNDYRCLDCGEDMGSRGKNHDYCTRCLAVWYEDNGLSDVDIPNGDFDDDGSPYPKPEY
jgi:hypothetical protein